MAVIALDLGGTKLSGAIVDKDGSLYSCTFEPLNKRTGDQAAELITGLVKHLRIKAKSGNMKIEGIGCCVPGIVYRNTGTVWAPNIPGWENYPLEKALRIEVDSASETIVIDNDRACSVLGEIWQGAANGYRDAIFIAVGTGIGAGIVSGGNVIRGHSDIAGAIGWLALDQPFRDEYIPVGCFEHHASGAGLAKVVGDFLNSNTNYNGILRNIRLGDLTAFDVFKASESGDPLALRVIREAISFWGMAAANLVSLFNPEIIIFGGGVFGPAVKFLDDIAVEAAKWAQPVSIKMVRICASKLGGQAGLLGAAYQVFMEKEKTI